MSDLNRVRYLAGLEVIEEDLGTRDSMVVDQILKMAEARAYDEGAEIGNVTSDMIYAEAKRILDDIDQSIAQKLQAEMR
jgi:hypothetical protein